MFNATENSITRLVFAVIAVLVCTDPVRAKDSSNPQPLGFEILQKLESQSGADRAYAKGYVLGVYDGYLNRSIDVASMIGSLKREDRSLLRCIGIMAAQMSDEDLVDIVRLELKTDKKRDGLLAISADEAILKILERKFPCDEKER